MDDQPVRVSQNESNECSAHIAIDQSLSIYLTRVRDKQQSSYISVKQTMLPTYLQTHVWQLFVCVYEKPLNSHDPGTKFYKTSHQ